MQELSEKKILSWIDSHSKGNNNLGKGIYESRSFTNLQQK